MSSNSVVARRIERTDFASRVHVILADALRDVGPTLIEPRVHDVDRALRVLARLTETLAGFAFGCVVRLVTAGMRRWFGDDGATAVHRALHDTPTAATALHSTVIDHDRPLASELLARLHVRFCDVAVHTRALIDALRRDAMTGVMFASLANDDLLAVKLREELARGWRIYVAAVTTRQYGAPTPLWQHFIWQLDGKPVLTRDAVLEAGYIALVR